VSETLARALNHRGNFYGGSLLAWTTKILRNAYLDDKMSAWNRYRDRAPSAEELQDIVGIDGDAEQKLMLRQTLKILAGFGRSCRELLVLSAMGYKIREIAEWLDIPLGTAGGRMIECRERLYNAVGRPQQG
jgi:DNA-directed RNA polymerase specialized sigma24 family protein